MSSITLPVVPRPGWEFVASDHGRMISVTKLLGGASYFGDRLRYHDDSAKQTMGARPDSGPVVVWNSTKTCNLECVHCYADAEIRSSGTS